MPASDLDWDELLSRYEAMAVAFVRGLVADPEVARDLYQEAASATGNLPCQAHGAAKLTGAADRAQQ
jgi:hypothetical protein